jgi:hypothetical protein
VIVQLFGAFMSGGIAVMPFVAVVAASLRREPRRR